MIERRPENRGQGLDEMDVEGLFGKETMETPKPAASMFDYKQRASGERSEEIEEPGDEEAQGQEIEEMETPKPDFSSEPWPSPIEGVEPQKQTVQALAKTAGCSMIDVTKAPQPRIPERVRSELRPSDKTWATEIIRIFRPAGLRAWSAPLARGLVRPSIMGHDEEKTG